MGENNCKRNNRQRIISKIYQQLTQLNTRKTTQSKKAEDLNRRFSKEDIQMAHRHKTMLNTTNYQRNENQNHNEVISLHWSEWPLLKKNLQIINAGEGVEKREHSCTVGGNANLHGHHGVIDTVRRFP